MSIAIISNTGCYLQIMQKIFYAKSSKEIVGSVSHMFASICVNDLRKCLDGLCDVLYSLHRLKKHGERGRKEKLKVCANLKWRRDKNNV